MIRSNSILFHVRIYKFYFVCEPRTKCTAARSRRLGHICLFFRKMAAYGANDAAVRGFLHQLLHSIVRQIENNDGRGDNGDGVLCRVDWLYNCLVRYVGSYNIDENIDRLVGRSRDMLEDIVNAHSNSDNNGGDKPTQLLSTCFSQLRVWLERVCLLRICSHIANQTIIKPINSVQNSVSIVATTVIVFDLANYRV